MQNSTHERRNSNSAADVSPAKRPPTSVIKSVIMLVVWMVVPWWLVLEPTEQGRVIFAVCVLFSLVGLGIAGLSAIRAVRNRPSDRVRGTRKWLSTWTGTLPMRSAVAQILLIPASLAVGFTALALVDLIVRS